MRERFDDRIERGRVLPAQDAFYGTAPGSPYGAFAFRLRPGGPTFRAIVSSGDEELGCFWEHVSVSIPGIQRCPTWDEMCAIKNLFWGPDEWVVQYHPAAEAYVSNHRYCLHMWRPTRDELPTPPEWAVGFKDLGELDTDEKKAEAERRLRRLQENK